jgi:hypothetical protein
MSREDENVFFLLGPVQGKTHQRSVFKIKGFGNKFFSEFLKLFLRDPVAPKIDVPEVESRFLKDLLEDLILREAKKAAKD